MDAKALAKSKRAHSQHHSKKHNPYQAFKAPSAGTIGAASPSGKQVRVKSDRSQGSSLLPSNWDRYEEEFNDSGSENLSQDNLSKATDVVLPKSKGADYTYLISEAKAQSQTQSLDGFASFDDSISDFYQGVGSLLSIKGQSLLSWNADDNFIGEDKATSSREWKYDCGQNGHMRGSYERILEIGEVFEVVDSEGRIRYILASKLIIWYDAWAAGYKPGDPSNDQRDTWGRISLDKSCIQFGF
ncbi:unnamed protein product [Ilex paraguariensis]|uniref:Uncharacterized protein n=1 Tax=Ilex paraguariensis TaxID=185542 RepID=A0ABC8TJD0_9AQUA